MCYDLLGKSSLYSLERNTFLIKENEMERIALRKVDHCMERNKVQIISNLQPNKRVLKLIWYDIPPAMIHMIFLSGGLAVAMVCLFIYYNGDMKILEPIILVLLSGVGFGIYRYYVRTEMDLYPDRVSLLTTPYFLFFRKHRVFKGLKKIHRSEDESGRGGSDGKTYRLLLDFTETEGFTFVLFFNDEKAADTVLQTVKEYYAYNTTK